MSTSHARAKVAGRLFNVVDGVENIAFEYRYRHVEQLGVAFDLCSVFAVVARIHHHKDELEREFVVAFQLLKQLCHEHGILAARNADGNFVIRLNKLIVDYSLCEAVEQLFLEASALSKRLLNGAGSGVDRILLVDFRHRRLFKIGVHAVGFIAQTAKTGQRGDEKRAGEN